jgi:predicted metal-dependent HD superfamily phosphohydrolase
MEVLEQFYAAVYPIITQRLDAEIPSLYAYHSLRHTLDVIEQVESIGKSEGLTERELMATKIAALFHDTGFLISRKEHEQSSCQLFRERAAQFELTSSDLQLIEECIMSTKIPQRPIHLPSRVLCDADLDYLGRPDYDVISEQLFKELIGCGELKTREEWQHLQINFLSQHAYHTGHSRRWRESPKNITLERIKQNIL